MTTARAGTGTRKQTIKDNGSPATFNVVPLGKEIRENLSTHVERHVRLALLAGHFAPGDRISLTSLADVLGTSVTPVREAVSRLAAAQALELYPGQIARVPAFDSQRYAELRDIRIVVECLAVERAAMRITKGELSKISRALKTFIAASRKGDLAKMLMASRDFRFLIYEASRMPALVLIIEGLWLRNAPSFRLMYALGAHDDKLETIYSNLFQALADRDVEKASNLVRSAVTIGSERLIAMGNS